MDFNGNCNDLDSRLDKFRGSARLVSSLQPKNAPTSKLTTASGSVREVSPHLENARKLTWVKLAGSFREASLRQFENM